jgi:L-ascorbate metabolism protein UlaG (beta-lactamase superfamily)
MRNSFIFTLFIALATNISIQATNNAEITYIGNEGFMISNNGKKVFIDALYLYNSPKDILDSEDTIRKMIMNNTEPFSNSQLYLVTHNHPDHCNLPMVTTYLKNNTQADFVSYKAIVNGIKASVNENQLVSLTPNKYVSIDTTVNDIPLTVYNFIHDKSFLTYNLGFYANIGGLKIFHGGDNTLEDSLEYQKYKLYEKDIDVLFLNSGKSNWKTNRAFIKKYINPKFIILMHVSPTQVTSIKQQLSEIKDTSFPQIVVFNASMEKIEINDTMIFVNNMPENIAKIKDTTYLINSPIDIKLPLLFKDIDVNDSITYTASGIPKGVSFDSISMKILGNAEKAGNYVVKILARDKSLCINSLYFRLIIKDPVSINSSKNNITISFYPNPATDKIYINNTQNSQTFVQIFDLNGKLVLNEYTSNGTIDISDLSKGIYFVKSVNYQNVIINKLVKE